MAVSLFQLFSIGIGPSSSHTVGPMRAARLFGLNLEGEGELGRVASVTIELFGSLAMTGEGHATDIAVILGLEGNSPEEIDPNTVEERIAYIQETGSLDLLGKHTIPFFREDHLIFHKGKRLPYHSNAMRFKAFDVKKRELHSQLYYSVGGGFVVPHEEILDPPSEAEVKVPYPFKTCEELLAHCNWSGLRIDEVVLENEKVWRSEEEIRKGILHIWSVMQGSVERGCAQEGILPGGLGVKRRAPALFQSLSRKGGRLQDPSEIFDWVSLYALAVNEENAAGGRVVTAPTNGASGIIPAVLAYYRRFVPGADAQGVRTFLLTAAALGMLYKRNASL